MTNHPIEPHPVLVRVAKAIWEVSAEPEHGDDWDAVRTSPWFDNLLMHARAALLSLREPQNDAWDGLARQLIMWMDMEPKTPRALFRHLKASGYEIPQWLRDEPEMQNLDHVPSKGTRAMLVFTAMINTIIGESA